MKRRNLGALTLVVLGQIGCGAGLTPRATPSQLQGAGRPGSVRTVHIASDSTAAEFPPDDARVGWGAVLATELSGAKVDDAARSGRSSKSFRDEGLWAALLTRITPGDLVLIQFGHNDEKDDPARHTDPATTFRDNLRRFVQETRARGAVAILITPICRRRFDGERVKQTHGAYPEAVRAVAAEMAAPLIDLTEQTARLLERYGPGASAQLFAPDDNTHLSAEGAHAIARLVVAALVQLHVELAPRAHTPWLAFYPAPNVVSPPAVVVCPGGGYTHLSVEKEGRRAAAWLNQLGIAAFVLHYRLADFGHPAPFADVQSAVRLVRARASELGLDAARVGVLGFSAGGHLAACASCLFEDDAARPDFAILSYPVITLQAPFAHAGSRRALLGLDPDPALVTALSMETRVTPRTPPTFVWHTRDDASVPVENSLLYAQALERAGVAHELVLYQTGPHGLGLDRQHEVGRQWPKACEAWLRSRQLL